MGTIYLNGKMLRISNDFSEATGPKLLKFHVEPPLGKGIIAKIVVIN